MVVFFRDQLDSEVRSCQNRSGKVSVILNEYNPLWRLLDFYLAEEFFFRGSALTPTYIKSKSESDIVKV